MRERGRRFGTLRPPGTLFGAGLAQPCRSCSRWVKRKRVREIFFCCFQARLSKVDGLEEGGRYGPGWRASERGPKVPASLLVHRPPPATTRLDGKIRNPSTILSVVLIEEVRFDGASDVIPGSTAQKQHDAAFIQSKFGSSGSLPPRGENERCNKQYDLCEKADRRSNQSIIVS